MDVIAAYRDVGSYRGAAEICGTTHSEKLQEAERPLPVLCQYLPGDRLD
jgi:hypothetical protein